jgi:hypothetical protein
MAKPKKAGGGSSDDGDDYIKAKAMLDMDE